MRGKNFIEINLNSLIGTFQKSFTFSVFSLEVTEIIFYMIKIFLLQVIFLSFMKKYKHTLNGRL